MSSTRNPSNGSPFAPRGVRSVRKRACGTPRRWSARGVEGRARRAEAPAPSLNGGRGFAEPSRGLATKVSRTRKWSNDVTLAPLAIGALGIRKVDARSSTSSTVCSAIHSSMIGSSAVRSRKSFGSSIHSGCSTIAQKSSHCCPVPHPSPTSPSRGGADTRSRDEAALPHGTSQLIVERHRVVREAHRQGFEHRHVDELADRAVRLTAASVPMAAKRPESHSPIWPPTNTGARSGLPRASPTIPPDHACSVNSVAALSSRGLRARTA